MGDSPPEFSLQSSQGQLVRLADHLGKRRIVLYFYPKADTPGCTTETCGFRDAMAAFSKAGIVVFGISPDPFAKVKKFAEKFQINFPLLADEDREVSMKYGVWEKKSMYGREYMGVSRTTFLIDQRGTIQHIFEKVKPAGHEQKVLEQWEAK